MTGQLSIHQRAKYGKYAPLLDRSYSKWTDADKVAAYHGYADDRANERADDALADYQTACNLAEFLAANFGPYWGNEPAVIENRPIEQRDVMP